MTAFAGSHLEIISRLPPPGAPAKPQPLLFVHGAFAGAWCWEEHFLPYFAEHGYAAHALSLRGHGKSDGHEHIDWWSIRDYVEDVLEVVDKFDNMPVLIGHSMGGFVVQKALKNTWPPAVVLMATVPPQGLLASSLSMMFSRPDLLTQLNRVLNGTMVETMVLREALFAQEVDEETLQRYYLHMQSESQRAIWDMTLFDLPRAPRTGLPPMLVLGAEQDQLIPASQARSTASYYGVPAEIFAGMGHGLMLEKDWRLVADKILDWLADHGL